MEVLEHVARELALDEYDLDRQASIGAGAYLDAVLKAGERAYLIEITSRLPNVEDIAQLALYRDIWLRTELGRASEAVAVLVVPGVGSKVRKLAHAADIKLVEVPSSLLPKDIDRIGETPLTTEKSWAVVGTVLAEKSVGSIRSLAESTGVSIGWTHRVLGELQARGAVVRRGLGFELEDPNPVLDAIAAERPFSVLKVAQIETELETMGDLAMNLQLAWSDLHGGEQTPNLRICGITAAAHYTGTQVIGDRFDVYCDTPERLEDLFEGREGGMAVWVFDADRENMGPDSTLGPGGIPTVSKSQALLDIAGTGMAFRDLALDLLEVLDE